MRIDEFVGRLQGVKGPGANGEYIARCPAHDDSTASLSVAQGDKGIVMKCHAGCDTKAIVAAMGLSMRDLFDEPLPSKGQMGAKEPKAQASEKAEKSKGKIDKVYHYQDEQGKTLFEVVRFVPKDFRQRVPDPSAKYGYRWSIKGVRRVVYRLPEVVKAIIDGRTVYVVEGEKDADNMAALDLCATTASMGAEKWQREHSQQLTEPRVCIIPDNDEPGKRHAQKVAEDLAGFAAETKILDIAAVYPALPEKGDISDVIEKLGFEAAKEFILKLEKETPVWTPPEKSEYELAQEAIGRIPGYCVEGGRICEETRDGSRALCTFVAAIDRVVLRNDGQTDEKLYQIKGWDRHGKKLKTVQVPLNKFAQMNWPLESWDTSGNIMPGNMVAQKLRNVINQAGENAERLTIYTHTGWRKNDDGSWMYLYPGGAVGAEEITVSLEPDLIGTALTATFL
ncbi:MAG: hypothetical protein ACOX7B_11835 [Christensenellales bacterium]